MIVNITDKRDDNGRIAFKCPEFAGECYITAGASGSLNDFPGRVKVTLQPAYNFLPPYQKLLLLAEFVREVDAHPGE